MNLEAEAERERELVRLQVRAEFVDPAEAAGLAGAAEEAFGSNGAPISGAVFLHVIDEHLIFFHFPWTFLYIAEFVIGYPSLPIHHSIT